jgi:hypothetical protein
MDKDGDKKEPMKKAIKDKEAMKEEDAYGNDRFQIKDGKAIKDNSGTADKKDHVYAPDAKTALKLHKQGKKVYKEAIQISTDSPEEAPTTEDITNKGKDFLMKAGFDPMKVQAYMAVFNDHGDTSDIKKMNMEKVGLADAMSMVLASHDIENESTTNESPYTSDKIGAGFIMANKDKIIQQLYAGGVQSVLDPKDAVKAISDLIPDVTEQEIMNILKKENVKEAIQISTDSPEEATMMMRMLQMAGIRPLDQDMINQPEKKACGCDADCACQQDEAYANEPDVKVQDIDTLVNFHSGGLNRQKRTFPKVAGGDNPMQKTESLADSLRTQYAEFKANYQTAVTEAKKSKSPYAVGMAQAMKSTGDKPPLKKATIKKAHDIAKAVKKGK